MTYEQWRRPWSGPGRRPGWRTRTGRPAGYIELDPQDDGVVEIMYFGLIPAFRGRRIGGHLLSYGVGRAWDLAERWPERPPTKRVWLHTCSQGRPVRDGQLPAPGVPALRHQGRSGGGRGDPGAVARRGAGRAARLRPLPPMTDSPSGEQVTATTTSHLPGHLVHIVDSGGLPREARDTLPSCLELELPW